MAVGDGPIDAAFSVIEKITGKHLVCKDFEARSATVGRDAQGEASLEIEHDGITCRGRGVSTDTVEATIRAILNAVNRIEATRARMENAGQSAESAKTAQIETPTP
jgi:2-isopropylmalate synthase